MPINYTQLATEINTDPKTLGYKVSGVLKSDYDISVILNTPGASAETIFKAYTDTTEIVAGIVRAEFDALTAASKSFLTDVILKASRVKTGDANIRTGLSNIFSAGTSRTNLINAASKSATRGEVLFGEGVSIGDADVAKALGRG